MENRYRFGNSLHGIPERMGATGKSTEMLIVETAYDLFYREGFSRVSIDRIAAAAGFTKRTVYLHFESKDALVDAVLDHQCESALALIASWGGEAGGDNTDLVSAIFEGLMEWASRSRWLGSGYTRAAMEFAGMPGHPARVIARRHKQAVEEWLCQELCRRGAATPEKSARQLQILIEGSMNLTLIHGDTAYIEAAREAAISLTR